MHNAQSPSQQPQAHHTIGEHLDGQIAQIRQTLEKACIAKAKAEAAGLLNYPLEEMRRIAGYHMF